MSRCKDQMCGATDCDNCYPSDPGYADDRADEFYDAARQAEIDHEVWAKDYERVEKEQDSKPSS